MGALTLKSYPFELRGWDVEKFESVDPTDGFGSSTRAYVSKNQVIQLEPDYDNYSFNTWLTDKGRQFYDGIFSSSLNSIEKKPNESLNIIKRIIKNVYFFNLHELQQNRNYFFTIIFENTSLETIALLIELQKKFSFIKIRKAEKLRNDNDLESSFQLNLTSDKVKLNSSTLCLLIATNPRFEGFHLNLNLRQRFLKGGFKCLIVGSLIDLTFETSFLGSNLKTLKSIVEGNHLACQDIKFSSNPLIILNDALIKRNDNLQTLKMIKYMSCLNLFNQSWNGLSFLNSGLSSFGSFLLSSFLPLTSGDLNNFSTLQTINLTADNISNLKMLTELKILNFSENRSSSLKGYLKNFINQNSGSEKNLWFFSKLKSTNNNMYYTNIPVKMFYENKETFVNTEGYFKRTTKLIPSNKLNTWSIYRRIFGELTKLEDLKYSIGDAKISFDPFNLSPTKLMKFQVFQLISSATLSNISFHLNVKNQPFFISINRYRKESTKITQIKCKYWLDDFFIGGNDGYSQNSLILSNCSKISRLETTNFF